MLTPSEIFLLSSGIFSSSLLARHIGANMFDIKALETEVEKEVREERQKRAKAALKEKLKQIENAKSILANLEREKADLLASIADGSF